eukprot:174038_1
MSSEKWKIKGNSFYKQKDYQQAFQCYSEAIKLDSNNAIYFCNRAACYSAIDIDKYFCKAIVDCERAIELNSNYAKAYSRLAWICHKKGGVPKSIINYQRAINCLKNNESTTANAQLKQYQKQLKLCQSKIQFTSQASVMAFQTGIAKQVLEKHKMKQKYRNYFILSALGIPEKQIPSYKGNKFQGEKSLSLNDILNEISMIYRMLYENPEATVNTIDEMIKLKTDNRSDNEDNNFDMSAMDKCVDKIEQNKSQNKVDHSFKYQKISKLKEGKKEFQNLLLNMDKNDLDARGTWGLMVWKFDRAINKFREAINNNESDEKFNDWDDEDLNEEDDIYSYPDCMAKKLLFEYDMMPWDETVDATLAKLYNW